MERIGSQFNNSLMGCVMLIRHLLVAFLICYTGLLEGCSCDDGVQGVNPDSNDKSGPSQATQATNDFDSFRTFPLFVERKATVWEGLVVLFESDTYACIDSGLIVAYETKQSNKESLVEVVTGPNYIGVRAIDNKAIEEQVSPNSIIICNPNESSFNVLEEKLQMPCQDGDAIKYCKQVFKRISKE
ncbi:hypothetical protein [Bremerella cremea]|uniref:hypothetical protein n=1 Tax=Bremerella cremea TaxID=1031537 RepID=UPI0031EF12F4